jgi:3-oxoacyl-[acyl-carrier protein] reductase
MSESLAGKVALITGVSRAAGIGAAIARELGTAGARLFLSFHRRYDEAQPWGLEPGEPEAVQEGLRDAGVEVEALELDLADSGAPARLIDAARARFGRLHVLVNNAAHSENGDVSALDAGQLDRHYAVNLRAAALLCTEFVRQVGDGCAGRIINITSGQGFGPMPEELAYVASKGGLDALTTSLAPALAPRGITINAVDPGATDTGWMTAELKGSLERAAPMGRVGLPEDAARLVRFLASDEASWITGQILRTRGGA